MKWIPCSVKLPSEQEDVQFSIHAEPGRVLVGKRLEGQWIDQLDRGLFRHYADSQVYAWRSLSNDAHIGPPDMFAIGSPKWNGISKLDEEAGEVVQVIGKLMGTGGERMHWDGSDLRQRLIEEIGDVLAACEFVAITNDLETDVEIRRDAKLKLFFKWNAEQQDNS